LLDGREEPSCQLVALLARRLEAGPALLDVASGAVGELAHVVLSLADDRRDLRVPVVEHIVKQQHGSLLGREALKQHQHGQRQRVGGLSVPGRIVVAVGDDRLWQPLADIALAKPRWMASSVEFGPGIRFVAPIRSTNLWSLIQPRRRTSSSRIIAVCAAGPPNAIVPSLRDTNATSRTGRGGKCPSRPAELIIGTEPTERDWVCCVRRGQG